MKMKHTRDAEPELVTMPLKEPLEQRALSDATWTRDDKRAIEGRHRCPDVQAAKKLGPNINGEESGQDREERWAWDKIKPS